MGKNMGKKEGRRRVNSTVSVLLFPSQGGSSLDYRAGLAHLALLAHHLAGLPGAELPSLDEPLQFLRQKLHGLGIDLVQILPDLWIPAGLRKLAICLQPLQLALERSKNIIRLIANW